MHLRAAFYEGAKFPHFFMRSPFFGVHTMQWHQQQQKQQQKNARCSKYLKHFINLSCYSHFSHVAFLSLFL
jgi:hypothetical protein